MWWGFILNRVSDRIKTDPGKPQQKNPVDNTGIFVFIFIAILAFISILLVISKRGENANR
jgi:hypothetical protein